jgi:hypothetical protein
MDRIKDFRGSIALLNGQLLAGNCIKRDYIPDAYCTACGKVWKAEVKADKKAHHEHCLSHYFVKCPKCNTIVNLAAVAKVGCTCHLTPPQRINGCRTAPAPRVRQNVLL